MRSAAFLASIFFILAVPASWADGDEPVLGTEHVVDARSFWQNEMELAPDGDVYKTLPTEMQSCIVEEILNATPQELDDAVDIFVAHKTKRNYAKIITPLLAFAADFKKKHGERLGTVAGKTCITKLTE